jgi:hypothetical protein
MLLAILVALAAAAPRPPEPAVAPGLEGRILVEERQRLAADGRPLYLAHCAT